MNRTILKTAAGSLLLISLAACGQYKISTPQGPATCSVGTSGAECAANGATYSIAPGGGSGKNTPPVATTPAAPASSEVTAAPSDTSTATTTAAIGPCNVSLSPGDMQELATSQTAREDLAACMQIPPANQAAFTEWLAQYALQALNSGDFQTQEGCRRWADSDLSGAYYQYR